MFRKVPCRFCEKRFPFFLNCSGYLCPHRTHEPNNDKHRWNHNDADDSIVHQELLELLASSSDCPKWCAKRTGKTGWGGVCLFKRCRSCNECPAPTPAPTPAPAHGVHGAVHPSSTTPLVEEDACHNRISDSARGRHVHAALLPFQHEKAISAALMTSIRNVTAMNKRSRDALGACIDNSRVEQGKGWSIKNGPVKIPLSNR